MSLRTIMIFPEFENIDVINDIRKKYDSYAELVKPHITIVFPFELAMSNDELSDILNNRMDGIKPFEVEFQGISKVEDEYGKFLFLDMTKGAEHIIELHDLFYTNEFKELDMGLPYTPHITVGRFDNMKELNKAYNSVKKIQNVFSCRVDKITVEMIGEDEGSIIVIEKKLG